MFTMQRFTTRLIGLMLVISLLCPLCVFADDAIMIDALANTDMMSDSKNVRFPARNASDPNHMGPVYGDQTTMCLTNESSEDGYVIYDINGSTAVTVKSYTSTVYNAYPKFYYGADKNGPWTAIDAVVVEKDNSFSGWKGYENTVSGLNSAYLKVVLPYSGDKSQNNQLQLGEIRFVGGTPGATTTPAATVTPNKDNGDSNTLDELKDTAKMSDSKNVRFPARDASNPNHMGPVYGDQTTMCLTNESAEDGYVIYSINGSTAVTVKSYTSTVYNAYPKFYYGSDKNGPWTAIDATIVEKDNSFSGWKGYENTVSGLNSAYLKIVLPYSGDKSQNNQLQLGEIKFVGGAPGVTTPAAVATPDKADENSGATVTTATITFDKYDEDSSLLLNMLDELKDTTQMSDSKNVRFPARDISNSSHMGPVYGDQTTMCLTNESTEDGYVIYDLNGSTAVSVKSYTSTVVNAYPKFYYGTDKNGSWTAINAEVVEKDSTFNGWKGFENTVREIPAGAAYLKIVLPYSGNAANNNQLQLGKVKIGVSKGNVELSDIKGHWGETTIKELVNRGIINGYEDKTFCPDRTIDVDAFVKMTLSALDLQIQNGENYWAETYIAKAKELGIVKEGEFSDYTRPINRQEMARMIARASDEAAEDNVEVFEKLITDYDTIDSNYQADVVWAFSKGILTGYEDGSFQGTAFATRAEASTVVLRMLKPEIRNSVLYSVGIYSDQAYKANAEVLANVLNNAGFVAQLLTDSDMENSSVLNSTNLNCVILLNAVKTDGVGKDTFINYLKSGGDLVVGGEKLFSAFNNSNMTLPIYEGLNYEPHNLAGTNKILTVSGQNVLNEQFEITGAFNGTSAIGYIYPHESEYIPIMEAKNNFGQTLGYAAGVLTQFDGDYKGGHWLIYGIGNQEFYGMDGFKQSVASVLSTFNSGALEQEYTKEKIIAKNKEALENFQLTAPAPTRGVTVSEDGKHLLDANGKKLFLVAANTLDAGEFYHNYGSDGDGTFSVERVENLFKMASESGINCFRLWYAPTSGKQVDVIRHMARKYGIYLYLVCDWVADPKQELANIEALAKAYGDEPMVIGYDLANEPTTIHIFTRFTGEDNPLSKGDLLEEFKDVFADESFMGSYTWLLDNYRQNYSQFVTEQEYKNVCAADVIYRRVIHGSADIFYDFTLKNAEIKTDSKLQPVADAVHLLLEKWITTYKEAIRVYDPDALITAGYHSAFGIAPSNKALDFTNQHVYVLPNTPEDVIVEVETYDRLRKVLPNTPIMLGEFGHSGGHYLDNGEILEYDVGAMMEVLTWLYPFAKGYTGGATWIMLERSPIYYRYSDEKISWLGKPFTIEALLYLERHGVCYYDGNLDTRYSIKPQGHAMAFFKQYRDTHETGDATIEIIDADNQAGKGFVFKGDTVEYVAHNNYNSDRLSFQSETTPIVMLDWSDGLKVMATEDVTVNIRLAGYISDCSPCNVKCDGVYSSSEVNGQYLKISLLKGETVKIAKK